MASSSKRGVVIAAVLLLTLAVAGFAAYRYAVQTLKDKIETALGPRGEVAEIRVSGSRVEILGLRIRAAEKSGWPAEDELRAERITVAPDLGSLFSATPRVGRITVEGGYLAMLRTSDGRLRVLPSLLEKPAGDTGPAPAVHIGAVELKGSALEFFDASVRRPALKLRLEQLDATLENLRLPDLTGDSALRLAGVLKGVRHDGKVSVQGTVELASKDMDLTTRLAGVDLVALQPYLIKAAETGVRKGSLDMNVKATVKKRRLHAPGTLTLAGLELASGGSFMGMPRAAVVSLLKDRNDRITVNFVLEGNLDDPRFSLNESFASRVGASMAGVLGVSLEGLAKGVSSVGGGVAKGVGSAVNKLFGK